MTPQLALLGGFCIIIWLLAKDVKRRPGLSRALWIPLFWMVVLGSRPISLWFGSSGQAISNVEDGSPVDRLFFQALMVAGLVVLFKRHVNLRVIISENKWLFLFFLYLGISASWSDYSFVSFKRWIKDLGNVVMVLVILSETEPINAAKAVFLRCAYILAPLSVIYIKYFPDVGRYYNRWTWTYSYGGVTTDKNMLGLTLIVCGLFLLWELIDIFKEPHGERGRKTALWICFAMLAMTGWLFKMANSATSEACFILGAIILVALKVLPVRRKIRALSVPLIILALLSYLVFNMGNAGTSALGRDSTFTGRTEIWQRVLSEDINPLIGVGFYSFWLGDRVDKVSEGFYYHLNESHNGYIETYLNSGWIGILLLAAVIVSAALRLKHEIPRESDQEAMIVVFLAVMVVYNITEAAFNRMDVLWICFLLACINRGVTSRHGVKEQDRQTVADQAGQTVNVDYVNPFSRLPVAG